MKRLETIPSERLKRCFEAGSVAALFPLLQGWTREELMALVDDVDTFHGVGLEKIGARAGEIARGAKRGRAGTVLRATLKRAQGKVEMRLMMVCSEISSVAQYYLHDGRA
jgi:hypothetical protein